MELAAAQWIAFVVIWGGWQLVPRKPSGSLKNKSDVLSGVRGLRYVMSLAIGFVIADFLGAVALQKPLSLTEVAGLVGLGLGAAVVLVGATRLDRNKSAAA